ncbi:hypothetical protein [Veronia pacifica]|nr:hypothetical protein [Veronia pacifica]
MKEVNPLFNEWIAVKPRWVCTVKARLNKVAERNRLSALVPDK